MISGTIQENTKRMKFRRLRKTPELNQRELQENKHLEGTRRHHAKAGPTWGPPQADRPCGGADRSLPNANTALLLEGSSTTYEGESKPHV